MPDSSNPKMAGHHGDRNKRKRRRLFPCPAFVGGDFFFVPERQADVVKPFEQTLAAERVQFERERQAARSGHGTGCQIDRKLHWPVRLLRLEQLLDLLFGKLDEQNPVFERIVVKNVSETGRDHDLETVIGDCPRCVFTGRTAPEITPGQQNRRLFKFRPVQLKIGVVTPVFLVSPVEKEKLAKAGPLNPFQKLLRDKLVGIHVASVHRDHNSGVLRKRKHVFLMMNDEFYGKRA